MSYVFLKSCFVYFLSFRVKVLNINGFAQPQRMRIDNTEGVTQKRNHHAVLIIPSVTKKMFLSSSLPSPPSSCRQAHPCCLRLLLPPKYCTYRARTSWSSRMGGTITEREYVKKETSHPAFPCLDMLPFQQPCSQCAWGREHQVSKGSIKHSRTP